MTRVALAFVACLLVACTGRGRQPSDPAAGLQTMEYGGRTRSYLVRVPSSVASETGLPLVLVLHGGGGNAANAERMTGFTTVAHAEGFIVVYPEGTSRGRLPLRTWNAGHCCGYAMESRVDDTGFLRELIREIGRRYPIDPNRIYVTGMSNGAMMAHRAGMELGGTIAAIAPLVGGVFGDEPAANGKVSALMINGMLDRSVPYEGGSPGGPFAASWDGTPVRPALAQAGYWAESNACTNPLHTDRGAYVHVRYRCPDGISVELYGMKNGGHAWPGGERGSRLGDVPPRELDATQLIWEFFRAHPRHEFAP